jgi:hypothetical protein
MDEAFLVKGPVLAQSAVDEPTDTSAEGLIVERASDVALVKECDDLVAGLKASDVRANSHDLTGTIGGRDDVFLDGERVQASRDNNITVVEGGGMNWGIQSIFANSETCSIERFSSIHLTRTSVSPSLGTRACSLNLSESGPFWPWTRHSFWVVGTLDILDEIKDLVERR